MPGAYNFLPYNFYSNLPQLSEMLYLLALVTRSDVAAKLLHWLFGVMTAASIIALGTRLWSRRVGLTAAVLFYCLPYVQDLSQTARIDLATTFFATLAFGGLLLKWDTLSALAAGCAVATKWTAIPVVALPLVGAILVRDRKLWPAIRYGLLIAMPVVPWLVKNTLLAGDPVYPLWLKSPHWSAEQAALFAQKHYPVFGWNQLFERAWQYSFAEPGAVPLILLALPLVVFCWRQSDRVRWTAYLFVGAYAGWFLLTFRPWRFLMPAIPLAALVGGFALEQQSKWFKSALVLLVTVALALMGTTVLVDARDPATTPPQLSFLQHALGESSRTEFIRQLGRGVYEPVVWMNEHLPASAKVLYVGEARVYYARHHALWSTAFDQHPLALPDLDKLGVTHVYINFSELQRLSAGYGYLADVDWGAFRRYLQTRAREIYRSDRAVVYEL